MKIIAFGHRKGVGKDTAARFLMSYYRTLKKGSNIQKVGLADKVKDICYQLYSWAGIKDKEFYDEFPKSKEIVLPLMGKSPRQIWIEMGTLVAQEVCKNTWVDYVNHHYKADVLIISDLRFLHEANLLLKAGGYLFKINRIGYPRSPDMADDPLEDYDKWTEILNINEGDLVSLNREVIRITDRYLL